MGLMNMKTVILLVALLLAAALPTLAQDDIVTVSAVDLSNPAAATAAVLYETDAVRTLITADAMGLHVYDTDGEHLQTVELSDVMSLDLRQNVEFTDGAVTLLSVGRERKQALDLFTVDESGMIEALGSIELTVRHNGSCLYTSETGIYVFATSSVGKLEQRRIDLIDGELFNERERRFTIGDETTSCVADDALGVVYITEPLNAIWKYCAEPQHSEPMFDEHFALKYGLDYDHLLERNAVMEFSERVETVAALALHTTGAETGYLIASTADQVFVFDRGAENDPLGRLVLTGDGDGVQSDLLNLGALITVMDGQVRLADWQAIAEALGLPVTTALAE